MGVFRGVANFTLLLILFVPSLQISLEVAPARIASEYYTNEEMVQFKKPKKRKLRKKEKFKVDDLLPLSNDRKDSKDHGSRR